MRTAMNGWLTINGTPLKVHSARSVRGHGESFAIYMTGHGGASVPVDFAASSEAAAKTVGKLNRLDSGDYQFASELKRLSQPSVGSRNG